jgi:ketosteroid isomerase-like protein
MPKSLEQRIQALEDMRDIANLKARYINGADSGFDAKHKVDVEDIVDMFIPNGWWHASSHARFDGHDAIRKGFLGFRDQLPFAYHNIANPLIEVDGDRAHAEWHMTWTGTDESGLELWTAGVYLDELVRTAKGWKFESVYLRVAYQGPYADGWANSMGVGKSFSKPSPY